MRHRICKGARELSAQKRQLRGIDTLWVPLHVILQDQTRCHAHLVCKNESESEEGREKDTAAKMQTRSRAKGQAKDDMGGPRAVRRACAREST